MEPAELRARQELAGLAAPAATGVLVPGLAALLRVPAATLRVVGVGPAPDPLPADALALALASGSGAEGRRAVLAFPLGLARGLVDLSLGRPASAEVAPLTSGEEGALLFAVDRGGGDWIAAGGRTFTLRGILADADQATDYLGRPPAWQIEARLEAGAIDGPLWLWCGAPVGEAGSIRWPLPGGVPEWPVTLRVVVGWSRVDAREVEGLAPGDVVVLDVCDHPLAPGPGASVALRSGSLTRAARWLDRRRLQLVSTDERRSPMDDKPGEQTAVSARLEEPLDDEAGSMEVLVRVELGRVALPLSQALSLMAGGVLELDRDAGPDVQLTVGDKLIARGELVECEGRLAVQITEVT